MNERVGIGLDLGGTSQKLLQKLYTKRIFFELGSNFAKKNADRWESFTDFLYNFEVPSSMLREFRKLVAIREVEMTNEEYMGNKKFFQHRIKAEVARGIWGLDYFYRVLLEKDNQFQSARTLFPWAKKITNRIQIQTLND